MKSSTDNLRNRYNTFKYKSSIYFDVNVNHNFNKIKLIFLTIDKVNNTSPLLLEELNNTNCILEEGQ